MTLQSKSMICPLSLWTTIARSVKDGTKAIRQRAGKHHEVFREQSEPRLKPRETDVISLRFAIAKVTTRTNLIQAKLLTLSKIRRRGRQRDAVFRCHVGRTPLSCSSAIFVLGERRKFMGFIGKQDPEACSQTWARDSGDGRTAVEATDSAR
jgi:hypothetical protein